MKKLFHSGNPSLPRSFSLPERSRTAVRGTLLLRLGCLRHFRTVLRPALHPVGNARSIESSSDNVVPDTRKVLNSSTSDQNNAVLLQIVADSGDVRSDFHSVCKSDPRDLSESGVRLLRSGSSDVRAHAALLRTADIGASLLKRVETLLQRGSRGFVLRSFSSLANQLVKCRHLYFHLLRLITVALPRRFPYRVPLTFRTL